MRPSRLAFAAWLAALGTPAYAGFGASDAGTATAQFLKLGAGARGEAMGEAYTAVVDEANAVYWNPAAIGRIEGHSATFMHAPLPGNVNYEFLGYAQKLGAWGGFGFGLQYLSQPGINQTDSNGFEVGDTFHPNDFAATAGYAYTFKSSFMQASSLGINAKFIQSTITKSVMTGAVDLGFVSAPLDLLGGDFRFSYVVQNLGGQLRFDQVSDPLPLNLRLGTSWIPLNGWTLSFDFSEPIDNHPYVSAGTEYRYVINDTAHIDGRVGFNSKTTSDLTGFNGFTAGIGLKFTHYGFDYAITPMGTLGVAQRVSLSFSF